MGLALNNGQVKTSNSKGDALAYGGAVIAAGATAPVVILDAKQDSDFMLLNLSMPSAADWLLSHFVVKVDGNIIMNIVDQTAQFINQAWKIPYALKVGNVVTVEAVNGAAVPLRFGCYLGISVNG